MLANKLLGSTKLFIPFQNTPVTINNPNSVSNKNNDWFGYSVALSDNYGIIGAHLIDETSGSDSGRAYVIDSNTGAILNILVNPNAYGTSARDYFGYCVDISGNYAIVGAYQEDDAGGTSSGKAYIFDASTGNLIWVLNNPNAYGTSASDYFGFSVAIDGNYAIVSAYLEDDASGNGSGKAYIFNVATGALVHTLNNPNAYGTVANDYFGYCVAIDGNYAVVGAYMEDDAGGTSSGKVYVFDVTTGVLIRTINNPNAYGTSANDYFGASVAISGNLLIVGAYMEDDAGGTSSGKAYIFNVTTGVLLYILNNPNAYGTSANDYFGYGVDIDGIYAIVGAYLEDDAGGSDSGKAYVFNTVSGALVKTMDNPNAYGTSKNDYFGYGVAINGTKALVGAYQENDASGARQNGKAYLYK